MVEPFVSWDGWRWVDDSAFRPCGKPCEPRKWAMMVGPRRAPTTYEFQRIQAPRRFARRVMPTRSSTLGTAGSSATRPHARRPAWSRWMPITPPGLRVAQRIRNGSERSSGAGATRLVVTNQIGSVLPAVNLTGPACDALAQSTEDHGEARECASHRTLPARVGRRSHPGVRFGLVPSPAPCLP